MSLCSRSVSPEAVPRSPPGQEQQDLCEQDLWEQDLWELPTSLLPSSPECSHSPQLCLLQPQTSPPICLSLTARDSGFLQGFDPLAPPLISGLGRATAGAGNNPWKQLWRIWSRVRWAASRAQKEVFNPKRNHTGIGEGVSPQKEPHRH